MQLSRIERLFVLMLVVVTIVLSVRVARRVAREGATAFARWQPQLRQLKDGIDISERHHYPNPPMMAVMLEPIAHLPPVPASLTWFYLKVGMAVVATWQILRAIFAASAAHFRWLWMLVVLCGIKPILDDLSHGNVNVVIFFLIATALTAYRAKQDLLTGLILALAIACKLTPALFLPYLAWKRCWSALLGCALGLALFLYPGWIPAWRLGADHNQRQLVSWYQVMVHPFVVEGKVTSEHLNQSLPGLVTRLATEEPSFIAWRGDEEVALRYDNVLSLPPVVARLLVKALLLAFVLIVVWTCRSGDGREGWRPAAEFGLITLGMLLFSERTWKHHAVTLMLPLGLLIVAAAQAPPGERRTWCVLIGITLVLMIVPGLGGGKNRWETGRAPDFAKLAQVYGAYTWAFLLLTGGMIALLRPSGLRWPFRIQSIRGEVRFKSV